MCFAQISNKYFWVFLQLQTIYSVQSISIIWVSDKQHQSPSFRSHQLDSFWPQKNTLGCSSQLKNLLTRLPLLLMSPTTYEYFTAQWKIATLCFHFAALVLRWPMFQSQPFLHCQPRKQYFVFGRKILSDTVHYNHKISFTWTWITHLLLSVTFYIKLKLE